MFWRGFNVSVPLLWILIWATTVTGLAYVVLAMVSRVMFAHAHLLGFYYKCRNWLQYVSRVLAGFMRL